MNDYNCDYSRTTFKEYAVGLSIGALVCVAIFYFVFRTEISLKEYVNVSETVNTYDCKEAKDKYNKTMIEKGYLNGFDLFSLNFIVEDCSKDDYKAKLIDEIKKEVASK